MVDSVQRWEKELLSNFPVGIFRPIPANFYNSCLPPAWPSLQMKNKQKNYDLLRDLSGSMSPRRFLTVLCRHLQIAHQRDSGTSHKMT